MVIERALSKRALENTERSADDTTSFEARIKLLEELEAQQWADREKVRTNVALHGLDDFANPVYD